MTEKKSSDEETPDQNFNDDFDFGEGDTVSRIAEPTPASGLNKKVLAGMALVVLGVLAIMGYKIFNPVPTLKPLATPDTQTANSAPSTAKAEPLVSSVTASNAPTKVPPTTPSTTNTTHNNTITSNDQNFGDIAAAFSSSEPTTPAAIPTPTPTAPPAVAKAPMTDKTTSKEGSIENLKQELFTPEKFPTTTAALSTGTAEKTANSSAPSQQEVVQLSEGLNKLNHQIDYILNQIKYLDSYSREVSDNLNKLNDSISAMDNRIATLTNTTSTLSKDVGNVRSEVGHFKQVLKEDGLMDSNINPMSHKKSAAPKEGKITIEEPEYMVHAVIPGRAWLKSARGQIITVAEGDTIGNYGKILVIDAANGVVLTSSGIAFR